MLSEFLVKSMHQEAIKHTMSYKLHGCYCRINIKRAIKFQFFFANIKNVHPVREKKLVELVEKKNM